MKLTKSICILAIMAFLFPGMMKAQETQKSTVYFVKDDNARKPGAVV